MYGNGLGMEGLFIPLGLLLAVVFFLIFSPKTSQANVQM
jgi:hypothetical protein